VTFGDLTIVIVWGECGSTNGHGCNMLLSISSPPPEIVDGLCGIASSLSSMRSVSSYRKGERIYSETDRADHWYCVLAGAARKYAVLSDGRRQIVDFLLPGDFFGFRERHHQFFATDAIVNATTVARYTRRGLEALTDTDPRLGRELCEIVLEAISRAQARLLIMGRITSVEKVGAFLIEMAERSFDRRDQTIVLPMSRYDIADYLALSVETVSRALTKLREERAIRFVDKHRISILDRELLESGPDRHVGEKNIKNISTAGLRLTAVKARHLRAS
jgi:CRP/FNR family nitrogen fixation transcriptional regulator